MSLVHATRRRAAARANWGRWIADCGWCRSALLLEPGAPAFTCWSCHEWTEVVWPSAEMIYGIERLLLMRPDETTRNWEPGETLHDLLQENVQHGLIQRLALEETSGLLEIHGDSIRTDRLAFVGPRELKAVGR